MENSLYEIALKYEKYDKKYTIEEALKMASDFRKWLKAQIAKTDDKERTRYCEFDKKALEEVFKEGNTHVNLGN